MHIGSEFSEEPERGVQDWLCQWACNFLEGAVAIQFVTKKKRFQSEGVQRY
jgi:hypothetical protein